MNRTPAHQDVHTRSLLTHSHGLLPSKSNVKHTSGGQRSTAQKGAEPKQRVARNAYERALLKLPAEVLTDNMFPTDAEIDEDFIDRGYTEDQLAACRQAYHDKWDSMFKEAKRDTVDVIGRKPSTGDETFVIEIPNSPFTVRIWDGGLLASGLYYLDLIYSLTREPVNPPADYKFYPAPRVGTPSWTDPLVSWERSLHVPEEEIAAGAERFSVPHGISCCLKRRGENDFWFDVPEIPRQASARTRMTRSTA